MPAVMKNPTAGTPLDALADMTEGRAEHHPSSATGHFWKNWTKHIEI
jgi:hypothetical protein